MKKQSRRQAGFTLVEVLIAIVIFMFGMMAVANLFIVAGTSNQTANLQTATAAQASEVMERLRATKFTNLVPGGALTCQDPDYASVGANYKQEKTINGVGVIRTTWQIADPGAGGSPTYFIIVRSEGTGGLGGARSRAEFTTFRACTAADCPCPGCP